MENKKKLARRIVSNDIAIKGFAKFLKNQKRYHKPCLVLFEYGLDIEYSKKLIKELNIQDYVVWKKRCIENTYIKE